jgi:hypothetical protein
MTVRNMSERVAPFADLGGPSQNIGERSRNVAQRNVELTLFRDLAHSAILVYRSLVEFDAYALTAVDIINARLTTRLDLVALLGRHTRYPSHITDRDLVVFQRAKRRLRAVFEHGTAGRGVEAVEELNALLVAFPIRPRIAPQDAKTWRMQIVGRASSVSSQVLAGAIWGLAVWLCRHGSSRFGVCADARCGNVYLDTSSNCCRRFCSERCATRSHVAAHRARKRARLVPR